MPVIESTSGFDRSLPVFGGDPETVVNEVVNWVMKSVSRQLTDPIWICDRWMRRTFREVVEDGFTLAYGACADRAVVTSLLLARANIPSFFLFHVGGYALHSAVEIDIGDGEWRTVDYGSAGGETRLMDGRYAYVERIAGVSRVIRLSGPRYHAGVWTRRHPLRLLGGLGLNIEARFQKFADEWPGYCERVQEGTYPLSDQLVTDRAKSVIADEYASKPLLRLGSQDVDYIDLSHISLYLEAGG